MRDTLRAHESSHPSPAMRDKYYAKLSRHAGLVNICTMPTLCNTPGVCHQLSNGFELKHGILSDDEDVKVKPIETSPNLNLDIAPLLAYRPLFKIYAWVV